MRTEIMQMNNDELNELTSLIRTRREILSLEAKSQFVVGDKVTFKRKDGTRYMIDALICNKCYPEIIRMVNDNRC